MKLKKWLTERKEDEKVALGASSSFFYIGDAENVSKHLEKINDEYRLAKIQSELYGHPEYADFVLKNKLGEKFEKTVDLMAQINKLEAQLSRLKKQLSALMKNNILLAKQYKETKTNIEKKIGDEFIVFEDRKVIKDYIQDAADFAHVAIVEGDEVGKFWTESEFLSGKAESLDDEN